MKADFATAIESVRGIQANLVRSQRSMRSLCREMAVHKFLFKLGIAQDKTKDCDFEAPIKWYAELGYFLMGWCRVFIK